VAKSTTKCGSLKPYPDFPLTAPGLDKHRVEMVPITHPVRRTASPASSSRRASPTVTFSADCERKHLRCRLRDGLISPERSSDRAEQTCERPLADSASQLLDQQLIDLFHATGRAEYLEELLERHLPIIRSMVYQMLLDQTTADDVTQEVFLRVVRGIDQFDGQSQFATWLYRITMNAVSSHWKKRGRTREQYHDELPEGLAVSTMGPERGVMLAELAIEVETALARLSPVLRAAIVLVCLQGHSAATAAEIEGCSRDTMYSRVYEARLQLKRLLAEQL
jgi:RNA polymerase sigma-70 factor, ECF subfamily